MFQFPEFPSIGYVFTYGYLDITPSEFPHSEISGSKCMCHSPKLIAAYHVFHRLLVPRHPPYTLNNLTFKLLIEIFLLSISSLLKTNWLFFNEFSLISFISVRILNRCHCIIITSIQFSKYNLFWYFWIPCIGSIKNTRKNINLILAI